MIVPDLNHPFFASLVKYIEMELYEQGYKTMICNTVGISRREQEYLDMLERNMVDGIITASHGLEVEEYRKQVKPIVSIDRDLGPRIPLIGCDHGKGGELAAELMLQAGRRKIYLVSGISPNVMANDRYSTFTRIRFRRTGFPHPESADGAHFSAVPPNPEGCSRKPPPIILHFAELQSAWDIPY